MGGAFSSPKQDIVEEDRTTDKLKFVEVGTESAKAAASNLNKEDASLAVVPANKLVAVKAAENAATTIAAPAVAVKAEIPEKITPEAIGNVTLTTCLLNIFSRFVYGNDHLFLLHISKTFGKIIPLEVLRTLSDSVKKEGISVIKKDKETYDLNEGTKKFELEPYKSPDGDLHLNWLPWIQQINIAIGEERISPSDNNCQSKFENAKPNDELVFTSIATSNYGEIYVFGFRSAPNLVFVVFRGTYSAKSALSYTQLSSIFPIFIGQEGDIKEKYLFGMFKLVSDIIHVLMDAIIFVGNKINPNANNIDNKISVLTSGHSLGGGLSTIFAYLYVVHIKSKNVYKTSPYDILNKDIGCTSFGSPRVFDTNLSNLFCCLTTDAKNTPTDYCTDLIEPISDAHANSNINIEGRITYNRVVSYNDGVPSLPPNKAGFTYAHPCSYTQTEGFRSATNTDCFVQVTNSVSTRCARTGRLAMTIDITKPLDCVNTKEARDKTKQFSPNLGKNPAGSHLQYLGLLYAGGADFTKLNSEIKRAQVSKLTGMNMGDTVCRIIIYPNFFSGNDKNTEDLSNASVVFYNLKLKQTINDKLIEKAGEEGEGKKKEGKKEEEVGKILAEDTKDTYLEFLEIVKQSKSIDINQKAPSSSWAEYGLTVVNDKGTDSSMESDVTGGGSRRIQKRRKNKSIRRRQNKSKRRNKRISKRHNKTRK
jgi:hypothetical protein